MMNELLRILLASADDVGRVFDFANTATWPSGAVEAFCRIGILRESAGSLYAPCPNCSDGHIEPVTIRTGADGNRQFYIYCPESMRVEVFPEMCRGWEINPSGVASAVAMSMGLGSKPKMVVADRFWRLGRTPWPPGNGTTREIVFARRMQDDDSSAAAAHVGAGGRAIVLVPRHVPDERIWPGTVPPVISLAEVMTWDDGHLAIDVMAMIDAVETADHLASQATAISLDVNGKRVLRREVKAEMKGQLEDDVLMAAYITYGSMRKAADALTEQLGRKITKDKVQRAVTRAGGVKELREKMDSPSVARTVASQRRDRVKKIMERR